MTRMNDRACGSRSVFFSVALLCVSAGLAGCGGGGDASANANTQAPQSGAPPAPSPEPVPPPAPTPEPQPGGNSAPTLSGTAMSSVNAGAVYSFAPSASDADGDVLTFQIENKPEWATFSTIDGKLTGAPTFAHAGAYKDIVISATDGKATTSLPAFSITVAEIAIDGDTLVWIAPSENVDGGALTDLAGFYIVYGPSSTMLHQSLRIDNPSVDRYVLDGLPAGTYYFAVRAYTASGTQSALSNIISKVIR